MKPTDILGNIKLYNADCMEIMKGFNDKQFDLAICDPPYGLGDKLAHDGNGKNSQSKFTSEFKLKDWDNKIPDSSYFNELMRVSKNQIIWGGNYFPLPPTRCFICWDKMVFIPSMSRIEQAWTSFDKLPQLVQYNNTDPNRIHLTQKPVKLYKWLLQNYAEAGDIILDTHFGSLSIGIACHDMKFDLTAIELDKDYYEQAKQRLINHQRQLTLF
ncbi:MAG TPA: DNA methyltransferase [Edaphocola sp.]|nr:DNA methyltransferase [Edaphocola sp.]